MLLEKDEKKYVRVSDILSELSNFSHISEDVLKNKCRIGTEVHRAICDDLLGNFPCLTHDTEGYFESYLGWKDTTKFKVVQLEKRYYDDDLCFTGQIDLLVRLPYVDSPVLVDFKTSVVENKIVWPYQAHLYGHLLGKNHIEIANYYAFVKLSKDGSMPKICIYHHQEKVIEDGLELVKKWWDQEKKVPF